MLEVESPRTIRDAEPDIRDPELSEEQRLKYMRCYYAVVRDLRPVYGRLTNTPTDRRFPPRI